MKQGESNFILGCAMNASIMTAVFLVSTPPPAESWVCKNDVEVWCAVDSCAAKAPDETTPMEVAMGAAGQFAVCAYTGCWEGAGSVMRDNGRLLITADETPFSSSPQGQFTADISLLLIEKDGVGFVRVGGIASPLLCTRAMLKN